MSFLSRFFKEKFTAEAKLLYALLLFNFLLGSSLIMINQMTHHYLGIIYFTASWQRAMLPLILLSGAVLYFHDIIHPRASLTLFIFSIYVLSLCIGLILTQGIETTPFSTIDSYLAHVDQLFDFNQIALINMTYHHDWLSTLFIWGYDSLIPELIILPLLLALLLEERDTKVFLIAMLISYPIGTLLFYFFPTTAPASIMHSPHFQFEQYDTYIKFYEMHHYLHLTTSEGGLVAFPSFHVIWGIFLIYLTRHKRWFFYPILIWNVIMIISTLTLGWHYLTDVISGIIISGLSLAFAEYCYLMTRRCGALDLDDGGGSSS